MSSINSISSAYRPAASANSSSFVGRKSMMNTLDREHKVRVVQHDANAKVMSAADTLDGSVGFVYTMPPKTLQALTATPAKLQDTLYYAMMGGYPERATNGQFTGKIGTTNHGRFRGSSADQSMEVKQVSADEMRKAMVALYTPPPSSMPVPDPQYAASIPARTKAIDTVMAELQNSGATLYKTHYEDDTQVYDGFVALNAKTGELRMIAEFADG